jgi:hypothetical protein
MRKITFLFLVINIFFLVDNWINFKYQMRDFLVVTTMKSKIFFLFRARRKMQQFPLFMNCYWRDCTHQRRQRWNLKIRSIHKESERETQVRDWDSSIIVIMATFTWDHIKYKCQSCHKFLWQIIKRRSSVQVEMKKKLTDWKREHWMPPFIMHTNNSSGNSTYRFLYSHEGSSNIWLTS